MKYLAHFTAAALALAGMGEGRAAVNFVASRSVVQAVPGGSFVLDLSLQITAGEQVTGIDYYWQSDDATLLLLAGRDTTGSSFTQLLESNAVVLASPGNEIDPVNAWNLGGGVANPNIPLTTGTWLVARYTFTLDPLAELGSHILQTFAYPGDGWVGPGPNFDIFNYSSQASIQVLVVPEPRVTPAVLGGGILLVLCLARFRRLRRRQAFFA